MDMKTVITDVILDLSSLNGLEELSSAQVLSRSKSEQSQGCRS